ncbi:MAG: hypothetical protein ACOYH4_06585 [Saccharofermentanales bacterium]|jgi:hypothetical protein
MMMIVEQLLALVFTVMVLLFLALVLTVIVLVILPGSAMTKREVER